MGELRKDYFTDRYVIISPERAKRPHDFVQHPMPPIATTPFTPGNENLLPPIIAEYPPGPNWNFRVVPNKFAIVRPQGERKVTSTNIFSWSNNYGVHEIVVEGREDGISFSQLGVARIDEAIRIAQERVNELQKRDDIAYVAYFKNERPEAGASINHPHSQIIALGRTPDEIEKTASMHRDLRTSFGFSPLYKILDFERTGLRMISESKHFVSLCPYASRYAFEVLIIPLRDSHSYTTLTAEERADLAGHLDRVLRKLGELSAPYNIVWIHTKSPQGLHWHLQVFPRLNVWAGFEMETGIIVNPTPPEDAAAFYRA